MIQEQVASEQSGRATCRGCYSCYTVCCYFARYYITNLLCLDFEYLGGPTFKWGGTIFARESSRKYVHPPLWAPISGTSEHQSVELLSTNQWNFWAPISGTSEHHAANRRLWLVCVLCCSYLYTALPWCPVGRSGFSV